MSAAQVTRTYSAYLLSSPEARGRSNKTTAFPASPLASCVNNVGLYTVKKKNARHNLPGLADTIFLDYFASTSWYHRRVFTIKDCNMQVETGSGHS